MSPTSDDIKSIFANALEFTQPNERAAYLDGVCRDNEELRAEVDDLLSALDKAGGFLRNGPEAQQPQPSELESEISATVDPSAQDETANISIAGKYSLVERIGEGGMGSVWRAKQTEPVQRNVAVKLIKAGMDSRQVLARFEAERQALALMDHPNIAKVFDGGLHNQRPFFVMELVKGVPITDFCDARRMSPRQRLELFVSVCGAIQHAHQKGVIHRDIKPSNVLIALYDDKPVVKVIDFGLAKATGGILTEHSLDTAFGGVLGTPQYMSPEQATFNNLDIDTRSDVYALGVLLYELLTGSPPYKKEELENKGFLEMLRAVREDDPPKPSSRLSTADTLPSLSANRDIEPKKLTGMLRNELDWVVMKALEKERTRRYETACDFSADIQRYLDGDTVQAHPPSTVYRLSKFVRRHQGQVLALCVVLLVLIAGIVGTSLGLVEARRKTDFARQETIEKERALQAESERAEGERLAKLDALDKQAQAERQRAIAVAVTDFLQNKLLSQANAWQQADTILESGGLLAELDQDPTVRDVLDRAAEELAPQRIDVSFADQPHLQAELLLTVGNTYNGIGEPTKAIEFIQKSFDIREDLLGRDDPETLQSMHDLAVSHQANGDYNTSLELLRETLRLRTSVLGDDHTDTLETMIELGTLQQLMGNVDEAIDTLKQCMELATNEHGATDSVTLISQASLANAYKEKGDFEQALLLLEAAVALLKTSRGVEHPTTLMCMSNLASAYNEAGKPEQAIPLYEQSLEIKQEKLGDDHPETLTSMNNLALGYQEIGKNDLAIPLLEKALELKVEKFGREHPETIPTIHNLALAYAKAKKYDLAIPLAEESLELALQKMEDNHPNILRIKSTLAHSYQSGGQMERGIAMMEEVVQSRKANLGPSHLDTIATMSNLGLAYTQAGKVERAISLLEEAVASDQAAADPNHPVLIAALQNLANAYQVAGRIDESLELYEEALKRRQSRRLSDPANILATKNGLAAAYWKRQRLDRSIPLFEECLKEYEELQGRNAGLTQNAVANLGVNYKDAGRLDEAIPLLEEAHEASQRIPQIMWVGDQLLDAYIKAGHTSKLDSLFEERLALMRQRFAPDTTPRANSLEAISRTLMEAGYFGRAEPLIRECLSIRQEIQPDSWTTFSAQSLLGAALLGQEKISAAEPLLLQGYEGMNDRLDSIEMPYRSRVIESLTKLVELYEAKESPEEVARWQEKLAAAKQDFNSN